MNPSILQLDHYTFIDFSVKCNVGADLDNMARNFEVEDLIFTVQQFESDNPGQQAIINLTVKTKPEDSENHRLGNFYSISLEGLAYMSFREDAPASFTQNPNSAEKVLVLNGANILYGLMRDRLTSITSAMPWGGIILPLASFDSLVKQASDEAQADRNHLENKN